jgi:hypothetical protein
VAKPTISLVTIQWSPKCFSITRGLDEEAEVISYFLGENTFSIKLAWNRNYLLKSGHLHGILGGFLDTALWSL